MNLEDFLESFLEFIGALVLVLLALALLVALLEPVWQLARIGLGRLMRGKTPEPTSPQGESHSAWAAGEVPFEAPKQPEAE